MFKQVNRLPGAKSQSTSLDGHGQRGLCQERSDVGGHIVVPLCPMAKTRVAVHHRSTKPTLNISKYIPVGVLLHDKRGGGVLHKDMAQTLLQASGLNVLGNLSADVGETSPWCGDQKCLSKQSGLRARR
jgi:hypothetical protein